MWIQIQTTTPIGCVTFGKLFNSLGFVSLFHGYYVVRLNEIINEEHRTMPGT